MCLSNKNRLTLEKRHLRSRKAYCFPFFVLLQEAYRSNFRFNLTAKFNRGKHLKSFRFYYKTPKHTVPNQKSFSLKILDFES